MTLVEMLVTVAVLVVLMTILVQIFQAATGSVNAAQSYQQLDDQLRRIYQVIHDDLGGVTATLNPVAKPVSPNQNLGYLEYGENEFADNQGEDSDDYIRFTAKAPPGRPFTGRMWVAAPPAAPAFYNGTVQPVTITSEYAEIIYFLRNGNLYRRVLLIAPELQSAIVPTINNIGYLPNGNTFNFQPGIFGGANVSWQGVNDLSARPASTGPNSNLGPSLLTRATQTIVLNTLGDLTNRENRFAAPRFSNDFWDVNSASLKPDGIPDDRNGDSVPDLYPSLYPGIFSPLNSHGVAWRLVFEPNRISELYAEQFLGFPWVYPGAYSFPQVLSNYAYGWIHSPTPVATDPQRNQYHFDRNPVGYLQNMNHNPLDQGDNLAVPSLKNFDQTWWGFPTWRETLSINWNDPTRQVNDNINFPQYGQPNGLWPRAANNLVAGGRVRNDQNLLPPMAEPSGFTGVFSNFRRNPQLFCDAWGAGSAFWTTANDVNLWAVSWEDDLILTGVRSFDVKAYDNALAGYADLGWGDDPRVTSQLTPPFLGTNSPTPYLAGNLDAVTGKYPALTSPNGVYSPAYAIVNGQAVDLLAQTFAHEGRIPPLVADNRYDALYGAATYPNPPNNTYNGNIGDDNPNVVRLRRVWDSWSTEYSQLNFPATDISSGGFQWGPPLWPPIYPSYPPPYPAPLRGLQIQIRVVDPTNQRIKSLTIRQDFTDKL